MLCTTNIWIKIQKCAIPHKNLYFLPTFVPENSSQETKKMALSETLYGKTPEQLAAVCAELGMPRFAAKQLARWLYAKHVEDPMRMSDIAAAHRAKLAERFRPAFTPPARITESADGTKKYLYRTQQGATSDGHRVIIEGNIGTPADAVRVDEMGGEGVGLFRSEFLFMDRPDLPTEEEQFEAYKQAAETMTGRPVIIRTLDIGGDKEVPALELEKEQNPFLGYRAIRICLDREELFMTQLRALLRASAFGDIRIMFPMISSLEEVLSAKAMVEKAKAALKAEGIAYNEAIKLGIMIEIPVAAICADILAKEVDFFSIGTNDLIQYSCAVDRINDKIASLYRPLHPGVLRLIKMAADAAKANGIECGVCGEMAGSRGMASVLCGLGVTNLSMSASSILAAKSDLAHHTYEECVTLANSLLGGHSATENESSFG